ncbi:hypothetical protein RMCBS344292_03838 [Rhizopus microsporus]|nr:hypothetical protein RMCBS344292_03838 [Rhizopus microsporus]
MNSSNHESTFVVLWYMNGCTATVYKKEKNNEKKEPIKTICFANKAYLAFKQIDCLSIAIPAIGYLNQLTSLLLQNNNIKELPDELWKLTSLEELNLGYNKIKKIPKEVGLLINLKELYLHNNEIQELPTQIGRLKHLSVLDLTHNQLKYLPAELKKIQFWQLWIEKNPLEQDISQSIMSLKAICYQIVGHLCCVDEESREIVKEHLPESMQHDILPNPSIASLCYHCDSIRCHSDLYFMSNSYLFHACSQSCFSQMKKIELK